MSLPARVLVTGAGGFVGQPLCAALAARGVDVRRVLRSSRSATPEVIALDLTADVDWSRHLAGVDAIVHLAALTHAGGLRSPAAQPRYEAVNVDATQRLAAAAARAGVGRFVFMSSIKVNGEGAPVTTPRRAPYRGSDTPAPEDNYGTSKLAAEAALAEISTNTSMAVTVLRPPLVYGPACRGNFLRLMQLVAAGCPLPLGGIANRRSLVYVDNLVEAVRVALGQDHDGLRIFTLADVTLSVTEMIERMAAALGVRARLVALPPPLFGMLRGLPVSRAVVRRLCDDLAVDATAAVNDLGWQPPIDPGEGFARTARWLREQRR